MDYRNYLNRLMALYEEYKNFDKEKIRYVRLKTMFLHSLCKVLFPIMKENMFQDIFREIKKRTLLVVTIWRKFSFLQMI